MSQGIRRLLSLAVVFAAAFLAVFVIRNGVSGLSRLVGIHRQHEGNGFRPERFTLSEKPPLELADVDLLARLDAEYAKLTEAVTPSVVSIDTAGQKDVRQIDIFGRQYLRPVPTAGQGSGVIVTEEGHVVTNHHVVAGQQQIQVTLHDGRKFRATLIGDDPLLDIAVLKIEGNVVDVRPLKFGDSTQVRRGQIVFAIGNPFGLGETITQGIISAVSRSISDTQRDLFQTDAAINPGNSGGPLVNLQGEIIGINSAIYTPDRDNPGFQGVGFSIPSNDVKDALYSILERGRPVRGYLGVGMGQTQQGVMLPYVAPGGPADQAGLRPGDVVIGFDGQQVKTVSQLITLVQRTRVGRQVQVRILRGGEEMTLEAVIAESKPDEIASIMAEQRGKIRDAQEVLRAIGVEVRDLSIRERARGFSGVVVRGVSSRGLAVDHLKPGDLVVAVNQNRVSNSAEFYDHLASSAAVQTTAIHFIRDGVALRADLPAVPRENAPEEEAGVGR